jgi:hypothetical protein
MTKKLMVTLTLSLILILLVALGMASAQEPPESEEGGELGEFGLADQPPTGFSVLYMFTGVANHPTAATRQIATSVHCTNFGSTSVQAQLQLFSLGGGSTYTAAVTINSNQTWTFSTQNTDIYREDSTLNTPAIEQGSGRVLANNSQLICTAQVLDPSTNPPAFMARLSLFDGSGNPVGGGKVYLPIILKNN